YPGSEKNDPVYEFGDICVDIAGRQVRKGGKQVHLTPSEFRMLNILIVHRGKVLTQRQLLNAVWRPHPVEHAHYLRIYTGHLRQKLETDPARPQHFTTETG
ncbi:hypothetical protein F9877_17375, partial [Morganella morganii]|uniref:winged helix-turn-helix domain-containing protein n=1 Tax=Morganella morganii TaxID=582 RepID=UPI0015F47A39